MLGPRVGVATEIDVLTAIMDLEAALRLEAIH